MAMNAKLTVKGQVTIPKRVRDKLNIGPGDVITFVQQDDKVVIQPARTLLDCMGAVKTAKKPGGWDEVRGKAREYVAGKVMGGK
ncbi:MAG: AbrB/MazE/SpoVT family DNA-binding domain-containing protein [Nitrospirae bacterium]|nr:AbrB/MazE/SpoVT family DNA-binding domain-containing protein [Nitrospirota bacterium]